MSSGSNGSNGSHGTKARTLFLAWQDKQSRRWYPIGRLTEAEGGYRFHYLRGVQEAQAKSGFHPLPSFPDLYKTYASKELFPLFLNRVMPVSRADYPQYAAWLHLNEDGNNSGSSGGDAIAFLGNSGGQKATDALEIFPDATGLNNGGRSLYFFVRGLRHLSPESESRAQQLTKGEALLLLWDVQNPQDREAIALRTGNAASGDASLVGFCPRYIASDVLKALRHDPAFCTVEVVQVNAPPAPAQFRVLCRLELSAAAAEAGIVPFSAAPFQPLTIELPTRSTQTMAIP